MDIVHTIDEVRNKVADARKRGLKIGFVPTMGYLHKGHLSLVEIAKKFCDYIVMSIFVNRIQFNDKKDFENYPVDLEKDFNEARMSDIDLMFVPEEKNIYKDHLTYVNVERLTEGLCGSCRPGHFQGVFTVVSKLFNIVLPDVSVFGQKDIQQAVSIEKMVLDLNFPLRIIIAPIIRESDGLAMSSRNKHLSDINRKKSLCIYESLKKAESLIKTGITEGGDIINAMTDIIKNGGADKIDYISLVNYRDLQPLTGLSEKSVIAVAAYFGSTRLIDNMIIQYEEGEYKCIY